MQTAVTGAQVAVTAVQLFSAKDLQEEKVIHALSILFVLAVYSRAPSDTKVSIYKGAIGLEIPPNAVPSLVGRVKVSSTRWLYGESHADFSQIVKPLSFVGNFYPPYSLPGLITIYKAAILALQKIESDQKWTKKEREDIPQKCRECLEKIISYTPDDEAKDRAKIEEDLKTDGAINEDTSAAEKTEKIEKWYRKLHPLIELSDNDKRYRDVYSKKLIESCITLFELGEKALDFDKAILNIIKGQDKVFNLFLASQHTFGK